MRHCPMTSFSLNADIEFVHGGHKGSFSQADLARADGWHAVLDNDHGRPWLFEHSLFYHQAGSPRKFFLPGLEDQFYCSIDPAFQGLQDSGRSKQGSRVRVMSAGMHDARIL